MQTSLDGFLDHQLRLAQPVRGWRAGTEAVLLAAAVPARAGARTCELGTSAGAAACMLAHRTRARVLAIEHQPAYAALAAANAERNGLAKLIEVRCWDIAARGFLQRAQTTRFAHVFFNPPFYDTKAARASPSPARRTSQLGSQKATALWLRRAASLLAARGLVTLIYRADALDWLLPIAARHFGDIKIKPLQPRANLPAHRVILQARLASRASLSLLEPLLLDGREAHAIVRGRAHLVL